MEAEIGSGEILSTTAIAYLFTSPFYCRDRRALPGLVTFFLAECYQQILMNTESTNGLYVAGNQRTSLFSSSEERTETKEKRAVKSNIAALFSQYYSDYSQSGLT